MRKAITGTIIVIALALMLFGWFMAAPWGASDVVGSNPRMQFAPTVFVIGVIVLFSSAVVYELLPNRYE